MSRKKKTKGRRRKSTPVLEDEPMPVMEARQSCLSLGLMETDNRLTSRVMRHLARCPGQRKTTCKLMLALVLCHE